MAYTGVHLKSHRCTHCFKGVQILRSTKLQGVHHSCTLWTELIIVWKIFACVIQIPNNGSKRPIFQLLSFTIKCHYKINSLSGNQEGTVNFHIKIFTRNHYFANQSETERRWFCFDSALRKPGVTQLLIFIDLSLTSM